MDTADGDSGSGSDSVAGRPLERTRRLIYASISRVNGPVLDEMRRIRDQAAMRNTPQGIRVALLHMGGWFVQWAEGPAPALDALVERVAVDRRHHGLRVLHRSDGSPRLFRPWIGSIVQGGAGPADMAARVRGLERLRDGGQAMEPARVWMALSAPPDQDMPQPQGALWRVMLLSAGGSRVFDLLRWLADEKGRQLVRRRFAGASNDGLDVASDYLDLPAAVDGGLRLIAHARNGVSMGVAHAFLPDQGAVVLWLTTDEIRNRVVLDRLIRVCRQVRHVPPIIGLGAPSALQGDLAAQARACGHTWLEAPVLPAFASDAQHWASLAPVLRQLAESGAG